MLQIYNNINTPVTADGILTFSGTVNRFGCSAIFDFPSKILLQNKGIYSIVANFTYLPTADGAVTISMVVNGVTSTINVSSGSTSTAGSPVNITIPSLIKVDLDNCCPCVDNATTINYIVDVAGVISNSNIVVNKVL